MKKIIREVDEKLGIVQVTIADERWYLFDDTDEKTELPVQTAVPSVTWVAGFYPKGIPFFQWLASKGWDEAEAIKNAAGNKGSKIHEAIDAINAGKEVRIDSKFLNRSSGLLEELTLEECDALLSYKRWIKATNPIILLGEKTLRSKKHNVAGTLDLLYRLPSDEKSVVRLLDFKSGQNVWPEHRLQTSAYKKMLLEMIMQNEINIAVEMQDKVGEPYDIKLEILQVGYKRNKNGYKLTELEDGWDLFQAAQTIWASEQGHTRPKKLEYPIIISEEVEPVEITKEKIVEIPPKKGKKEELEEITE